MWGQVGIFRVVSGYYGKLPSRPASPESCERSHRWSDGSVRPHTRKPGGFQREAVLSCVRHPRRISIAFGSRTRPAAVRAVSRCELRRPGSREAPRVFPRVSGAPGSIPSSENVRPLHPVTPVSLCAPVPFLCELATSCGKATFSETQPPVSGACQRLLSKSHPEQHPPPRGSCCFCRSSVPSQKPSPLHLHRDHRFLCHYKEWSHF